ncbi:MAG: phosphatase PAP2 family protein [Bacteroidales bacterium]
MMTNANLQAQSPDENYLRLNRSYLKSYFEDAGAVAVSPCTWQLDDWSRFGAVAAATGATILFDADIHRFFQRHRNESLDKVTQNVIDPMGTFYLAGLLGGMYLTGLATGNQEIETAALLTSKAALITTGYTVFFKAVFQRERPDHSDFYDPGRWGGPFAGFHDNAFPSGHAAIAFSAASVLSAYYHDQLWVGITSYTIASLVALSRVYDNKHWASDVIAGSALGYAIGQLIYKRHAEKTIEIVPVQGAAYKGIRLTYNF